MSTVDTRVMRPPVLVLGAHRSGTSFLASSVAAWGVELGKRQVEPSASNPRGYFEDEDFVEFHGRVLSRVLPPSVVPQKYGPIYVREPIAVEPNDEEREIGMTLAESRRREQLWGWKDPRTCLFLEYWLRLFPDALLVAVYRHPLEVFGSEVRRRSIELFYDPVLAIDSWVAYNRRILEAWDCHKGTRVLVCANSTFTQPDLLDQVLGRLLGQRSRSLPVFSEHEFHRMVIGPQVQEAFDRQFPAAAVMWHDLNERADIGEDRDASTAEPTVLRNAFQDEGNEIEASGGGSHLLRLAEATSPGFTRSWEHLAAAARSAVVAQQEFLAGRMQAVANLKDDLERAQAHVGRLQRDLAFRREQVLHIEKVAQGHRGELTEWRARFLAAAVKDKRPKHIFLWGANELADRVWAWLEVDGFRVDGLIDRQGGAALTPDQFQNRLANHAGLRPFVVVCSASARDEIEAGLRAMGLNREDGYVVLPDVFLSPEEG